MSGFFSGSSSRRRYPDPNMGGRHYRKKGLFGMLSGLGSFSGSGSSGRYGGYPNQGYPGAGYPGQGYPNQSYPGQGYPGQNYPNQSYPGQGYPGQNYPAQGYPEQVQPGQQGSQQSRTGGQESFQPDAPAVSGQTICPRCGTSVPAGSKFCLECGEKITSGPGVCSKCGKPLPAGAKFCLECGTPVQS